jgi:hypothetical protein
MLATAIGVGSLALGYKSAKSAEEAQEKAIGLTEQGIALSKEQMEHNIYQQQKTEAIFGPVMENLSNYYATLDPDKFKAQYDTDIELAFNRAQKSLAATLAYRGIEGSGIEVKARSDLEYGRARLLAETGTKAEEHVAEQQQQFMQLGLGKQAQDASLVNQAFTSGQTALARGAGTYANYAATQGADVAGFAEFGATQLAKAFPRKPTTVTKVV